MLFVLAGAAQRSVALDDQSTRSSFPDHLNPLYLEPGRVVGASWLPYVAPLAVFALLVYSQFDGSPFQRISLALVAAVVSMLALFRQFLARRDLLNAQGALSYQALHDGADRTAQPGARARSRRPDARPRAARRTCRSPRSSSTSTASSRSTTPSATRRETGCCASSRPGFRASSGRCDTVGRLGGDEFVILLDSSTLPQRRSWSPSACSWSCGSRSSWQETAGRRLSIGASIGIAVGARLDRRGAAARRRPRALRGEEHRQEPLRALRVGHADRRPERARSSSSTSATRSRASSSSCVYQPIVRPRRPRRSPASRR